MAQDNSRIAYRHPQPKESPPELVIPYLAGQPMTRIF